ncbi:MAG: tRNA 4-thiouridine(8) synthase ThiI [Natronospirillum sp.]|uniref:tRNA uracil 4-sulfurtransferase ThiI n=1 Tax=Natronospirillum sp. TaxID=2812955 RepID=UPI0025F9D4EB|nr:tRNA uracil 4-sulfurtransferase ThiI [Natronospirillum sp.]MCH8552136.1 tRNA 4-thiouridine(8) synthase ThiI [Natronospirillum sp.]
MTYLIKLHPEITIKSKSVRDHMIKRLRHNVRNVLRHYVEARVKGRFDSLEISLAESVDEAQRVAAEEALARIPGLHEVLAVDEFSFHSFDQVAEQVLPIWAPRIAGRSFRVRVKRRGRHDFSSSDLERYLGGQLLQAEPTARVDLSAADETLTLELKQNRLFVVSRRWRGLGGYPLGTQEHALALISGGFDSPVAAWRMMCRGARTHFLFFNLGGPAHEAGVREVVHHLWARYGISHRVFFTSVPFEPVVGEILRTVPDGLMGVVLKRMMLRVAGQLADKWQIPALVTGDAVAQVSSQSLTNLRVIDQVTDHLVLRPVITDNKQTIIDQARQIGTAPFAEVMPEYCGVISKRPNIRVNSEQILTAEADFDFSVLETAQQQSQSVRVDRLLEQSFLTIQPDQLLTLDTDGLRKMGGACGILDIRAPQDQAAEPLTDVGVPVKTLPFFQLQSRSAELDPDTTWLLYCDRGVMSRMQALHLLDQGLSRVGVFVRERTSV